MGGKTLRVGIVGCGGIAKAHLDGWKKNGVKVVAVTDVSAEAANAFAAAAGGAKVFADANALIQSGEVDAVSVCTPPCAHKDVAVAALAKGVHVLCEKPMTDTVAAAKAICEAAGKSDAIFMTAFRHRFLPAVAKIKEMLSEGTVGPVVFFNNIFCGPSFGMKDKWFTKKKIAGGGCIFDTNSHSIDLFRFLVGEVKEQNAVMHRHFEGTDVEDAGTLVVKADNGAIGSMTSSFVAGAGKAFIDIMGQKGEIVYDYLVPDKITLKLTSKQEVETILTTPSGGWAEQIAHFIKAVNGECKVSCTCKDGLRAVEIIQSVYR